MMTAFVIGELGRLIGTLFDPRAWLLMVLCGALAYNSARLRWVLVFVVLLMAASIYEAIGVAAWRGETANALFMGQLHALADFLILAYLSYFMIKIPRGRPPSAAETLSGPMHADNTASQ